MADSLPGIVRFVWNVEKPRECSFLVARGRELGGRIIVSWYSVCCGLCPMRASGYQKIEIRKMCSILRGVVKAVMQDGCPEHSTPGAASREALIHNRKIGRSRSW